MLGYEWFFYSYVMHCSCALAVDCGMLRALGRKFDVLWPVVKLYRLNTVGAG
jgi:hypothetical protein